MSDSGSGTGGTPAGWYPDGQGGQRWWDGTQWGPVGQPPAPEAPPESAPEPTIAMPTGPPPSGPPPGYGAYPPPGEPAAAASTGGPNKPLLLGIVGGLVGLGVLVVLLVLVLGGGDGASSDDPAETVSAFYDAARDGDCEAALDLLSDNGKRTFGVEEDDCESVDPSSDFGDEVTFDIGEAQVDGDDATVPVTVGDASSGMGPSEITLDIELVKTDGVWLIDGFGFGNLLEDLPEDLFSDLPDDFPNDFPSDFLSDFPSDFPSDFNPEDFMSDFPTDFDPEEFFSDFPTEFMTEFSGAQK